MKHESSGIGLCDFMFLILFALNPIVEFDIPLWGLLIIVAVCIAIEITYVNRDK